MPQLLSGGGSHNTSGLVLHPYGEGGGTGVNSDGNSSSSSRASSTGSSAGRFRAVVAISSDEDRDRIFYDDEFSNTPLPISNKRSYITETVPRKGVFNFYPVNTDQLPSGASRAPSSAGSPPPPPPKPPAKPQGRKGSTAEQDHEAAVAATLGMPEATRWCGADGNLPKVVAHENGTIVNGYLLVNGTDNLDLPSLESGQPAARQYHVTGMMSNGKSAEETKKEQARSQVVSESTFAGSRDVKNLDTLKDLKIVSSKGTVRGVKNRVRAGIATFLDGQDKTKNYRGSEKGKIVIYVTSMRIIRETYERCQKARRILQTHMVCFQEVDIFMSKENQRSLMERLGTDHVIVPQVFADGQHLGGVEELDFMNESGELRQIFQNFKKVQHTTSCTKCGGYRYVNCPSCHGSKKSLNRNHFTEEFCALRCVNCDENGLVHCDSCSAEELVKK